MRLEDEVRLDLRNVAGGTMSAKTICLGPCNPAPVVQVYPRRNVITVSMNRRLIASSTRT
ncbi:hypothetical protein CHELA20_40349 [Hyphomicrobiales bacterium]|nr:hypothetical protein CHELA20_40349 [Hyphomicrobiales bacterium]CAH1688290.1 hypothetical protein CHELA41_40205 [Hyphomicrobiales bacterium]